MVILGKKCNFSWIFILTPPYFGRKQTNYQKNRSRPPSVQKHGQKNFEGHPTKIEQKNEKNRPPQGRSPGGGGGVVRGPMGGIGHLKLCALGGFGGRGGGVNPALRLSHRGGGVRRCRARWCSRGSPCGRGGGSGWGQTGRSPRNRRAGGCR